LLPPLRAATTIFNNNIQNQFKPYQKNKFPSKIKVKSISASEKFEHLVASIDEIKENFALQYI